MNEASVFDSFAWWDSRDVLTYITPARLDYLLSVAGRLSGSKVLDLGCGGGLLAEPLARIGAVVTGVDVSIPSLLLAREHAKQSGLQIDYRQARAEKLPFADASFDTVVAFDVLEHVDNLPQAISEAARVLRPGGRFIFDTMNRTLLCLLAVIWIGERLWPGGPPRGSHQWDKLIRPSELKKLLSSNGIQTIEVRGFMPLGIDRRGHLQMRLTRIESLSYVGYGLRK